MLVLAESKFSHCHKTPRTFCSDEEPELLSNSPESPQNPIRSWKERASVVSLCQTRNRCNPACSPEKMGSAPGGLCTTGLQDRDVSTIAAIISSISTASDFLESNGWGARYFLARQAHRLSFHGRLFSWGPLTLLSCPLRSPTQATSMSSVESKATNVKSACSGWCLKEPKMSRCPPMLKPGPTPERVPLSPTLLLTL